MAVAVEQISREWLEPATEYSLINSAFHLEPTGIVLQTQAHTHCSLTHRQKHTETAVKNYRTP